MKRLACVITAALLVSPAASTAQSPPQIIFAQYYQCNQGAETQADEVAHAVFGPSAQKHVDAGHFTGWLWLTHTQGGSWRRVFVVTGTDLGTMMDAREAMVQEMTGQQANALQRLSTACGSHDDYIWTSIANSAPDPSAVGPATLSTYYACNAAREGRASQIFADVLAPLYEQRRSAGQIASWGFYAHRSGGIFRRLETFSGADHKTLLNLQGEILQEANTSNALAMNEFREICTWHTDYMWTNATR
ncbi:MAG: hypothetical protein L0271_04295 [Gemmatimonadetes bacterium]|nr:hypothetical protein [Gemmatimonadota bacterium]